MSSDLMTLFAWLAILWHPQLCLPAGTAETADTACTYLHFQGREANYSALLLLALGQLGP